VLDAVALLDFWSESFFCWFAKPELGRCLYTIRVKSLRGAALVALVFVKLYDYSTLRLASTVFIINVRAGM
jgi:hypothetical protein